MGSRKISQFQEIMQRVAIIIEMNQGRKPYDKEIAYELSLSTTQYANNKKCNKIPYEEIVAFCDRYDITINWILFGKSSIKLIEREEDINKIRLVESINAAYRAGGYTHTLQNLFQDKKSWDAVDKVPVGKEVDVISLIKNSMIKIEDMKGGYHCKRHSFYISLDETRKICYSNDTYGIYVNNLNRRTLVKLDIKLAEECQKVLGVNLEDYGVKLINDKPELQEEYDDDDDDWALSAF